MVVDKVVGLKKSMKVGLGLVLAFKGIGFHVVWACWG